MYVFKIIFISTCVCFTYLCFSCDRNICLHLYRLSLLCILLDTFEWYFWSFHKLVAWESCLATNTLNLGHWIWDGRCKRGRCLGNQATTMINETCRNFKSSLICRQSILVNLWNTRNSTVWLIPRQVFFLRTHWRPGMKYYYFCVPTWLKRTSLGHWRRAVSADGSSKFIVIHIFMYPFYDINSNIYKVWFVLTIGRRKIGHL